MPASRSVVSVLLRELGDFLYTLKRRPAGGRCAAVLGRRTRTAGAPASQRLPVARPHRPVDALLASVSGGWGEQER